MIKINWNVDINEKNRILNLHESATKKQYLLKEANGQTKEEYPPCIQGFGDPVDFGGGIWGIKGTGEWAGYNFNAKYYYDPNTKKNDNTYYCRGTQIMFGNQSSVSTGKLSSVTDSDTSYDVIKNGEKIVKIGSSGPIVKKIQASLVYLNYGDGQTIGGNSECKYPNVDACDGKFGNATRKALMKFQSDNGAKSDGIFGKQTYETMYTPAGKPTNNQPRQSTISSTEQVQKIAKAFCSSSPSNPDLIAFPGSKWDNTSFAEYAKQVNATDDEIVAAAATCPQSARTAIIKNYLKDPSKADILGKQSEYSSMTQKYGQGFK